MKRPGHDLTWYNIRHRWSATVDQTKNFSNHIGIHCPNGSPATISNNHTNIKLQHLQISVDRDKQRSDAVSKIINSPVPKLQHSPDDNHSSNVSHSYETDMIYLELRTIISQLNTITDYIWLQEKYDNESQDWKFVAMVIDRLCLILFLFFLTIFTILIFLSTASNFYNFQ